MTGARSLLRKISICLSIMAIISNIFIFTYPSINPKQCSWGFKQKNKSLDSSYNNSRGYISSIKNYVSDIVEQMHGSEQSAIYNDEVPNIHFLALGDPQIRGNWPSTPYLQRLEIIGNDYYLGHIFRVMKKRLKPSHVAIMGDIFSSQWISDSEFYNRSIRLTHRILGRNKTFLTDILKESHDSEGLYQVDWPTYADKINEKTGVHYEDVWAWTDHEDYLLINVTGNHDIGYSGDCTYQHLARYVHLLGHDNYWIEYDRGTDHAWRIVVLNDILLDGPFLQPEFLDRNWEFLNQLSEQQFEGSTILLTHIPLYKKEGLCYDGPEFKYYPEQHIPEPYKANLLKSQNHLSENVTNRILNLIFANGKPGLILTGHDHEGCETFYNKNLQNSTWNSTTSIENKDAYIKEITVRSVMGDYQGNTGLLTGYFNNDTHSWEWSFSLCPFIVQHVWWFTKITTIIAAFTLSIQLIL